MMRRLDAHPCTASSNDRTVTMTASGDDLAPERASFEATVEQLASLREFVEAGARNLGADPDMAYRLTLIADELATNIITHAYGGRPGIIDVALVGNEVNHQDVTRIMMTIADDGPAFDPHTAPPARLDLSVSQRELGGLGLHIVRELCDGLVHARVEERNEVTVTVSRRVDGPSS
jgi:serine/threonine-protein kinase RsbW